VGWWRSSPPPAPRSRRWETGETPVTSMSDH
jgi:hypothetical protein